jgi:hypothetical protein
VESGEKLLRQTHAQFACLTHLAGNFPAARLLFETGADEVKFAAAHRGVRRVGYLTATAESPQKGAFGFDPGASLGMINRGKMPARIRVALPAFDGDRPLPHRRYHDGDIQLLRLQAFQARP